LKLPLATSPLLPLLSFPSFPFLLFEFFPSVFLARRTNYNLYNKRVGPTKDEPQQQGIYYLERETEGWASGSAGKHI
jgi:hypothetical protein